MNHHHTRIHRALLGAGILVMALPAMAACEVEATVTHPVSGNHIIAQNGSINAQIALGSVTGEGTTVLRCEELKDAVFQAGYYTPSGWTKLPGGSSLQTNIPGIGVRIMYRKGDDGDTAGKQYPYSITKPMPASPVTGKVSIKDNGETVVQFFRTAARTNGGKIDDVDIGAQWSGVKSAYRLIKIQGVTLSLAACSIDAGDSDKVVVLGDHKSSDITRDGATDWRSFTLTSTDCDLSQMSDAKFTFSGTASTDPGLFAVSGGAKGIGIELWTDGDATDTQVIPGMPLTRTALAGGETYGFRARYKRLAGQPVEAGRADAVVNLNVSFN